MAFARGFSSDLDVDSSFELKVLSYYFNIHRIPCIINSPYRLDKNPSLAITISSYGHIRWKDFGTNDAGNLWLLLAKAWQVTPKEVEDRVVKDKKKILLSTSTFVDILPTTQLKNHIVHSTSNLQVKTREWTSYDLEYWKSYGISKEWLQFGNIYPISHIILVKENTKHVISAEKYAYVFVEHKDDNISLKVYQPYSTKYKWMSKHDQSVWDLWCNLPETGETLIITSSRKDALCIWANTGIPCTGLQGEGYMPKSQVVEELKQRFENIYILYDNDFMAEVNYGHLYGAKLAEIFGLTQIEIPTSYQAKDSSDLYHKYGADVLRTVIFSLIKKQTNLGNCPF